SLLRPGSPPSGLAASIWLRGVGSARPSPAARYLRRVPDDLSGADVRERLAQRGQCLTADQPAPAGAQVTGQVLAVITAGHAGRGPAKPARHDKRQIFRAGHAEISMPSWRPRPR